MILKSQSDVYIVHSEVVFKVGSLTYGCGKGYRENISILFLLAYSIVLYILLFLGFPPAAVIFNFRFSK